VEHESVPAAESSAARSCVASVRRSAFVRELSRPRWGGPSGSVGVVLRSPIEKGSEVMETVILEIRAAEGGADAKLLVGEQYRVYEKFMAQERL
jgi:hypothetical protein